MGKRLNIRGRFRDWLLRFVTKEIAHYEQRSWIDSASLRRNLRQADVLLVEGDQRISVAIKYLTQSTWSHAAIYIGDELVQRGGADAQDARASFGDEADSLLVEALPQGVVLSPLSKYQGFNLRLCRPHGLRPEHRKQVLDEAIASVGLAYDLTNIRSLLFYFLPVELFRRKFSGAVGAKVGGELPTEVICTSLIGHLFQSVGFPVLPEVTFPQAKPAEAFARKGWLQKLSLRKRDPRYSALFRDVPPTLLAPRDFDLSPYFEIIKFNVIANGAFDYRRIRWVEPEGDEEQLVLEPEESTP